MRSTTAAHRGRGCLARIAFVPLCPSPFVAKTVPSADTNRHTAKPGYTTHCIQTRCFTSFNRVHDGSAGARLSDKDPAQASVLSGASGEQPALTHTSFPAEQVSEGPADARDSGVVEDESEVPIRLILRTFPPSSRAAASQSQQLVNPADAQASGVFVRRVRADLPPINTGRGGHGGASMTHGGRGPSRARMSPRLRSAREVQGKKGYFKKLAEIYLPSRHNQSRNAALEYQGKYIGPHLRRNPPSRAGGAPGATLEDGLARLDAEIRDLETFTNLTPSEDIARKAVVTEVERDIRHDLPPWCTLDLFGSQRTGLATTTSDLDWRLFTTEELGGADLNTGQNLSGSSLAGEASETSVTRRTILDYVETLARRLTTMPSYKLAVVRNKAMIMLNLQHEPSGLDLQITYQKEDTRPGQEYIKRYLAEHPCLHPLYVLAKAMFRVRGFGDVYHGGFGSYCIFMMIVASLKLNRDFARDDIARHFLAFLALYAKLDTRHYGLSVEPPELFLKTAVPEEIDPASQTSQWRESWKNKGRFGTIDPRQPFLLCLRDPARPSNDLGKSSHGIKHLQATLKALSEWLNEQLRDYRGQILLGPFIADFCEEVAVRRQKLTEFGEQVSRGTSPEDSNHADAGLATLSSRSEGG